MGVENAQIPIIANSFADIFLWRQSRSISAMLCEGGQLPERNVYDES